MYLTPRPQQQGLELPLQHAGSAPATVTTATAPPELGGIAAVAAAMAAAATLFTAWEAPDADGQAVGFRGGGRADTVPGRSERHAGTLPHARGVACLCPCLGPLPLLPMRPLAGRGAVQLIPSPIAA